MKKRSRKMKRGVIEGPIQKKVRRFLEEINKNMIVGKIQLNPRNLDSDNLSIAVAGSSCLLSFETVPAIEDKYCSISMMRFSNQYVKIINKLAKRWFNIKVDVQFNNTYSHFWFILPKE